MCESCSSESKPVEPGRRKVRLRLWEVTSGYHCSVLGTCLSLKATRRIMRKAKVQGLEGATDYQVHCAAVDMSMKSSVVSRLLDKALERAHRKTWKIYSKLETQQALTEQWRKDVRSGDLTGAYWSVMHHPATEQDLIIEAFGTIHMLSHEVGGSRRSRLERYDDLETERDALQDQLRDAENLRLAEARRHEAQLSERDASIGELRVEAERYKVQAEARDPVRIEALEAERDAAQRAVAKLERQLAHALEDAARLEAEVQHLQAEVEQTTAPRPIPELTPLMCEAAEACVECGQCDLAGCTILYVGGEKRLVPKLRELTTEANGHFLHHDGGIEDSIRALPHLCARADVIFCPVTKVGHMAVDHVKRNCTENRKRFVPLPRASLNAFTTGLSQAVAGS